ncbi:MAG: hypothetical protein Q9186_003440 [Xanthomendoza sp. 1 TL-2023]
MASDSDFFVVRRFEKLAARVVLSMQFKIAKLEETVCRADEQCMLDKQDNGTFQGDRYVQRQKALEELEWRLERYQRFVLDHSELKTRPDASETQITYVKNWLENNNGPICPAEVAFVGQEDLMPMVPRVKPPLRKLIGKFETFRLFWWRRSSRSLTPRHYNHTNNFESDTTFYSEEEKIDKFVTCVTIGLGLGMLIAPLWLLQYVYTAQADVTVRLWVITGFIIGFTSLLSVIAVARPFEILAATAAYGAVLMVFMQLDRAN